MSEREDPPAGAEAVEDEDAAPDSDFLEAEADASTQADDEDVEEYDTVDVAGVRGREMRGAMGQARSGGPGASSGARGHPPPPVVPVRAKGGG